ncbi:hypothetical protein QFC20_007281 [Naganishia adeliensis]|nr:hypothetical protein QFC20_007281 [Naganishia adeliensis]
MDIFNAARRVTREKVRRLVDSSQPGATALSLDLQLITLRGKGWLAHKAVSVPANGQQAEKYWVGLVSQWQIGALHAYGRKACMDSTHGTGRGFNGEKVFLYSLVVRNKQTAGLTPAAWMVTNSEAHEVIEDWLKWLAEEIEYIPEYFMIDMSVTEARAIADAYEHLPEERRPKIHWCLTHVGKAWSENFLKRLPPDADLGGRNEQWERMRNQLYSLVHAENVESFNDRVLRMVHAWEGLGYANWSQYFEGNYLPFKEYWAGPWRLVRDLRKAKKHFYYFDRHWDRMLPDHIIAGANMPGQPGGGGDEDDDGENAGQNGAELGQGLNPNNALQPPQGAGGNPPEPVPRPRVPGNNPPPPDQLQAFREQAHARRAALYHSAIEQIRRQQAQVNLMTERLQREVDGGQEVMTFEVRDLEGIIESCESNRRHVAGALQGGD